MFGAALVLCASITGRSFGREPITIASSSIDYPETSHATQASLQMMVEGQPVEVLPPGTIPPVPGEPRRSPELRTFGEHEAVPLLDDGNNDCDPVIGEELGEVGEYYEGGRRGVRPYGGGHPSDWSWGCGGSPFRNGPGACDTFRVGPIWNVQVDGMTMKREGTDLQQIWNETDDGQGIPELFEQFDWAAGGRVSVTGKHPKYAGYQVQAAGEGIEKWEAMIVYPKQTLEEIPDPNDPNAIISQITAQRRVHYTTNFYSGELNILRCCDPVWQPFCGIRYFRFGDQLRIVDNQEALVLPLPADPADSVTVTDMTNLFNLENNLFGFQGGIRHDFWRPNSRFAVEGFLNGGVYYNKIKYTNLMNTTTTRSYGIDLGTGDPGFSTTAVNQNIDASDLSEIAYSYEASISAVCRLNKCWAMRAGYQVLWINGLRLADEAFLDPDIFLDNETHSMLLQGWHAGIECRR